MRVNRFLMFAKVLIVFLLFFQSETLFAGERITRTLVLGNGLEVLLVSDPDVHRSAAALSVGVGHLYDPEDRMGLAHYLEHMLFLGTKKYPVVDSYTQYLAQNSGSSNAYTGDVLTNYFFEVSHEAFEGALDRFSQFFKAPLFDPHYSEREVHAVDSEHEKNKLRDERRAYQAISQISEPGHPVRKFGTGNKETLAGDNRAALLDFYNKYYVASRMKLAILSKLTLAEQEELSRAYFSEIADRPIQMPPVDPDYRKPLEDKYRFMKIKAIKDIRTLTLTFPTIRLHDYLESKPAAIVGSVIGYEGKGSLLSKLKEEGLALNLSAGGDYSHPSLSWFDISVELTPRGEREYERVLELIFSYIQMLRERGFEEYTFKELQTMAQIDFDWKSPMEGMRFVASQAALMQEFKLEDVERVPYLYLKYEPEASRAILETLTPENALVVLQARAVETDQIEKFYGTEYSVTEIGGISFERLRNPPKVAGMGYPSINDFIPSNLVLTEEEPRLVRNDKMAKVWFKFDDRFNQPKVSIKLRIETPHTYDTVDNFARSQLYEAAVQEGLNEVVYPIRLAGLSYDLGIEKEGITLTLGGYSERLPDLLRLLAGNLTRINIDGQKFVDLKEATIRAVENRKLAQAYYRAAYYNRLLWHQKQYDEEELIKALESVTLGDLKKYARNLYRKVFITGIGYGNWTEGELRASIDVLLTQINGKPLPEAERYREVLEVLKPAEFVQFSRKIADNNNALYYGLQVGEMDLRRHARASLVSSIVETDFYTQMRTNQQLGYIVWSFNHRIEDRLFFNMIIQSEPYSPFELKSRVETWMDESIKLFETLTDEDFEQHRSGLIVSLEKEGDSIPEVANDLFNLATREKGNFQFKRQLIQAVKHLTREEVVAEAREIFLNLRTPRIVVLIRSNRNDEPVPEGVLTSVRQFKDRKEGSAGQKISEKGL